MKQPIQLFPLFIDSLNKLENSYKNHASLEPQDVYADNFIKIMRKEFDLKNIVNFRLPKNLEKISDMFSGMTFDEIIRKFIPDAKLPFPEIAIEVEYDLKIKEEQLETRSYKTEDLVILAKNMKIGEENFIDFVINYGVVVKSTSGKKMGKLFKSLDSIIRISTNPNKSDKEWIQLISVDESEMDDSFMDTMQNIIIHGISPLLFLMAALSCHNVEIQKDFPPSILENNKRIKKNLAPYKQLHYIVIKPTVKKGEVNAAKGSYTPKSTHVRRGHIRRYEEKGISIWIESTIINGGVGEVKAKEYILR